MKMIQTPWQNRSSLFFACCDITDRINHEESIRQSEERFRMIVDLSGVGLIIVDRGGNILFDNNASSEIAPNPGGPSRSGDEAPRNASFVRRHLEQISHVFENRNPIEFMTRLSVNNVPLWFEVSIRPFTQSTAQDCVLIVTRNVTEQHNMFAALQVSDHRFRVITENALDLILIFNTSHQVIFASKNSAIFTGYSDVDLTTKYLSDIVSRFEWDKVEASLRGLANGAMSMARLETEFVHRSGRIIPIELIIRQIQWEGHTCRMAFVRDISDRRHAERVLQESEALFRSVAERAFDAIVFIDETGRFLFANRRASELTGYRKAELADKVFHQLVHPSDKERVTRFFANRLIGMTAPSRYETYLVKKNGASLPIRVSIQELQLREQRVFLHIWKDISEKKRFRDEIIKISEWEKNRIGQDLHDSIGQQLAGMGFLADALALGLPPSENASAEIAHQISANCRTAHQQLRDIVRGLLPLGPKDSLASSLIRLAANVSSQAQIDCRVCHDLDTHNMDPICASHLLHIAQEATSNAIRHGKAKAVSISLGSEDGKGFLHIEDDGTGFDSSRSPSSGSGLKIMAFRADILKGVLTIRRRPPHGVALRCTFDLALCMTFPRSECYEPHDSLCPPSN
jgi:PAS domain S-box-containing protein